MTTSDPPHPAHTHVHDHARTGDHGAGKTRSKSGSASSAKWSQHVTQTSDAMDLKDGIFKQTDPEKIARSLKSSAEHSNRRKSDPYRSAMSMLTFYINRAGHTLDETQHKHLEDAKDALRKLFGKSPARASKGSQHTPKKKSK